MWRGSSTCLSHGHNSRAHEAAGIRFLQLYKYAQQFFKVLLAWRISFRIGRESKSMATGHTL